jgi:hypothetical protein
MTLYPYLNCDPGGFNAKTGYEHENEIPKDSIKPQWDEELNYYIGYSPIKVKFPSWPVFRSFVRATDEYYYKGGSYDYIFLSNLLPNLERYGILSKDYECHSNNRGSSRTTLNEFQISPDIVEWIDSRRYHFLTLEQFCGLNFNKYFDEVSREGYGHFRLNIEYLTKLHINHKRWDNKYLTWQNLSAIQKRHRLEKMEEQLRVNPVGFATRHFELMTALNSCSRDRKIYV